MSYFGGHIHVAFYLKEIDCMLPLHVRCHSKWVQFADCSCCACDVQQPGWGATGAHAPWIGISSSVVHRQAKLLAEPG